MFIFFLHKKGKINELKSKKINEEKNNGYKKQKIKKENLIEERKYLLKNKNFNLKF